MNQDERERLDRVEDALKSVQENGRKLSELEEKVDSLIDMMSQREAEKESNKDHPSYGMDPVTAVKSMSLELSEDTAELYHDEDYGLAGRAQEVLDSVEGITTDQNKKNPDEVPQGVDAQSLADSLGMQRHQVSSILHQLFLLRKLDKKRSDRKMYYWDIR